MDDHDFGDDVVLVREADDAGLRHLLLRREEAGLREAYRRHEGSVFAVARRLIGTALAEEVVQEVFLRLWSQPEKFEPDSGTPRAR